MAGKFKREKMKFDGKEEVSGTWKTGILTSLFKQQPDYQKLPPLFDLPDRDQTVILQKHTGYCWLIAAINCIIEYTKHQYGIQNIIFSKNYLIFYDKLEKANWFFEHILKTREMPLKSRVVQYLLNHAMTDRGQWAMAENLIQKYGLVPYEIMEDSVFSENTGELNASLSLMLRCEAMNLRKAAAQGMKETRLYEKKGQIMKRVQELLLLCYGRPPKKIRCPKDIVSNPEEKEMCPVDFFQKYIKFPFEDYVSIIPYGQEINQDGVNKQITLDGNVMGGKANQFLPVDDSIFQNAVNRQIQAKIPCWFTCDGGKFFFWKEGVYDDSVFDFSKLPGNTDFENLSREEMVSYHVGAMNHAMVVMDYQESDVGGWWLAKNSGEPSVTSGGYCFLSDSWFRKYVYQAVVKREMLPEKYQDSSFVFPQWTEPWEFFGLSSSHGHTHLADGYSCTVRRNGYETEEKQKGIVPERENANGAL